MEPEPAPTAPSSESRPSPWQARQIAARAGRGAAAGVAATLTMSGFMLAASRAGAMGRMPPRRITERLLLRAGILLPRRHRRWGSVAAHFGFGAGAGALFGAAVPSVGSRLLRAGLGTAYGALVWLTSYAGWLPATGLMPPPTRDRPARQWAMAVAHLVYGATLGLATAPPGPRGNSHAQG